MAPTPSPRPPPSTHQTPAKTPSSKHRLNFGKHHPPPTPPCATIAPTEHPVEVIGRIRDHPERKEKDRLPSALEISANGLSIRVRTESACRELALDGVSVAAEEDLEGFYNRFVKSRIEGVRVGAKCTVMMYGPTGSGKSHTMFGSGAQPGIVYRALRDILGDGNGDGAAGEDDGAGFSVGIFVQVTVLEIYNEEIYDLLSGNAAVSGLKGTAAAAAAKVRLEVMGKKAKNAMYISGNEASKICKEVAKVEKRRIVKSTLCNERSSRSHCMIILDVPSVGGRLMLVDMAGSENIEAAGQAGFEAKMQTAKINQGNTALKRVVECIANGDSHVPFRDSKLTMLLQDSFEDDRSKILMILCASPDPREIHKTISTLEYGAKAKCIVRAAHAATPRDDKKNSDHSELLHSRIAVMNQFISKLQLESKAKEKERDEAHALLLQRDLQMAALEARLKQVEARGSRVREEEIASMRFEMGKMEEKIRLQQQELDRLQRQLLQLEQPNAEFEGGRLAARLSEMCCSGDQAMVMSMSVDLDAGDHQSSITVPDIVKEIKEDTCKPSFPLLPSVLIGNCRQSPAAAEDDVVLCSPKIPEKATLSTVYEEEEEEEGCDGAEQVDKEVVQEEWSAAGEEPRIETESARKARIENIFRLCGDYREQQVAKLSNEDDVNDKETTPMPLRAPLMDMFDEEGEEGEELKENIAPGEAEGTVEVYLKWETSSKDSPSGNLMKKRMKLVSGASLSDLRKHVEAYLEKLKKREDFVFLLLGDPSGAPVARDKEGAVPVSNLPGCGQRRGHLACLRRPSQQQVPSSPLSSLENRLPGVCMAAGSPKFSKKQLITSPLSPRLLA